MNKTKEYGKDKTEKETSELVKEFFFKFSHLASALYVLTDRFLPGFLFFVYSHIDNVV